MGIRDTLEQLTGDADAAYTQTAARREELLLQVRRTRERLPHLKAGEPTSDWVNLDSSGRIAFGPTRPDGQPIVIGGRAINFWSADEFPRILDAFEDAVRAGELDDHIAGATPAGASFSIERLTQRDRS